MDPDFPTEEELFNGRRADGSKPPLHSRELYDGARQLYSKEPALPPVSDPVETEQDKSAAHMHYEVDLQHLSDLDIVADLMRELVVDAKQAACENRSGAACHAASSTPAATEASATAKTATTAGEAPTPQEAPAPQEPPEPQEAPEPLDASIHVTPEQADAFERLKLEMPGANIAADPFAYAGRVRPPRVPGVKVPGAPETAGPEPTPQKPLPAKGGHRQAPSTSSGQGADATDKPLTRAQRVAMGISGGKLLVVISAKRAEVAHRLIDASTKLDVRKAFMQDRAIALVNGLMLHVDQEWEDLGFGAWMPFRWPDQWLSFCGLLTRVLAANGLMHARHADAYRKLLDETPPVEFEGSLEDRIKESKTPLNPAQCKRNQGAETMSELKTRLQSDVWGPKQNWRKQWDNYWAKEHGVTPP